MGSKSKNNSKTSKTGRKNDKKGKKKWCSFHNSTSHDDSECMAQKDNKSASSSSEKEQQGANTAAEEEKSRDVVSKNDIARVFKHISKSLQAHDEDST